MAKLCQCPPAEPPKKPSRWWTVLGWSYLLGALLLGGWHIWQTDHYGTRVIITTDTKQLEFHWKCSTCGKDNYIKEVVR